MCLEDIEISRTLQSRVYATATSVNIPANPDRLAIRLTTSLGDSAVLSTNTNSIGGLGAVQAPLAYATRDPALAGITWGPIDDATLENCGEILKGPLVLQSLVSVGVFAIEVYFQKGHMK